jgi:hypothetical protein
VDNTFRSLASLLREARAGAMRAPAEVPDSRERREPDPMPERCALSSEALACCEEIALARVAALEAYERARTRLLERIAGDVLARELTLAPADVTELARRALEEFAGEEPVALVVSPADAPQLSCRVPVRIDASLERGDLIVIVRDGIVDARFAVRLRRSLRDVAA